MSECFRSILSERGEIRSVVLVVLLLGIVALPCRAQWTEPELVDFPDDTLGVNTFRREWCPFVTLDNQYLYFTRERINNDIYVSHRVGQGWSEPLKLPFCQVEVDERNPSVNLTNDTLYFIAWAPGWDIFWVFRTGECDTCWGTPERMPEPINSGAIEFSIWATPDNHRLLLSTTRAGGMGGEDIFECRRDASTITGWGVPSPSLGDLNTWDLESYPSMGLDTTEVFFWGRFNDIYVALLTDSGWTRGVALPDTINRVGERTPCITADGGRLYFESRFGDPIRSGDIWYSDRELTADRIPYHHTAQSGVLQIQASPNPAKDTMWIRANMPIVRLTITDLLGRTVQIVNLPTPVTEYRWVLPNLRDSLPSGSYYLTAMSRHQSATTTLTVLK